MVWDVRPLSPPTTLDDLIMKEQSAWRDHSSPLSQEGQPYVSDGPSGSQDLLDSFRQLRVQESGVVEEVKVESEAQEWQTEKKKDGGNEEWGEEGHRDEHTEKKTEKDKHEEQQTVPEQPLNPEPGFYAFPSDLGGRPIAPASMRGWTDRVSHCGPDGCVAPFSFPRTLYSVLYRPRWPVRKTRLQYNRLWWIGRMATFRAHRALRAQDAAALARPAVLLGALADAVMERYSSCLATGVC